MTRRELLAAGRSLFGEKGLYESRIEDLSRRAGIAKGTLYGYFANKEALVGEVLASGLSQLLEHVRREAQGAVHPGDARARIARAHLTFFERNPDLLRIFHQVRGLLQFRLSEGRPLRRALDQYLASLARVLADHAPGGARGRTPELDVAALLFGSASGIASTRAALRRGMPSAARTRATARALSALVEAYEAREDRRAARRRTGTPPSRTGGIHHDRK